ncbi:MAG: hypothetical protein HLUCCX14_15205 [Marinobacter excellens HL-55]|uniref:Phosphoribosyl-AMP cyclohydrolase n=1 Tax=Marinobacter excellens HL-55 TaxID=1305731 RepID=A0A0P8BG63_9GAMM|nr:MAG: hypothetical protein HLUCCX14_15205 [Marinobacter excellens HL-55]
MSKLTIDRKRSGLVFAMAVAFSANVDADIAESDVLAAQKTWGDAVVMLSEHYAEGGIEKARETAIRVIGSAYGYDTGPVLFKPTLASIPQNIRLTAEGALAYFVGHNENFPDDSGFGIKGWTAVEFENAAIHLSGPVAMSMGNVHFTHKDGSVTTVDKSFGYQLDESGNLRIVLHHSSLPYGR